MSNTYTYFNITFLVFTIFDFFFVANFDIFFSFNVFGQQSGSHNFKDDHKGWPQKHSIILQKDFCDRLYLGLTCLYGHYKMLMIIILLMIP